MNPSAYPVLARRAGAHPWKPGAVGERHPRGVPRAPLPANKHATHPLPDPSDWSFDLIERYHAVIAATAERYGLDTYPNQLEVIRPSR